jgi:transposase-like protein
MGDQVTALVPILPELPKLPQAYHAIKSLPEVNRAELLDAILAHYENGASIYDLAAKLGVNNATLYRSLRRYRLEDWKEVASARYEAMIEDAEKELEKAQDNNAVTRARERLAAARWKLERIDRKVYGQDQPAGVGSAVLINISLRRNEEASEPLDVVVDKP